jgi:hypothetical protein
LPAAIYYGATPQKPGAELLWKLLWRSAREPSACPRDPSLEGEGGIEQLDIRESGFSQQ